MSKTCKHSKERGDVGLCWGCKANRKAAYDLTGTDDPAEQKAYWDRVGKHLEQLRRDRFKKALQGK